MKKLEFRFYSLDEIAAATGKTERGDNFKRDTERLLARKGYSYEWHKGRGVTILSRDTSAQRRLKTLLVKRLGMNPDTNPVDFAYFIDSARGIQISSTTKNLHAKSSSFRFDTAAMEL